MEGENIFHLRNKKSCLFVVFVPVVLSVLCCIVFILGGSSAIVCRGSYGFWWFVTACPWWFIPDYLWFMVLHVFLVNIMVVCGNILWDTGLCMSRNKSYPASTGISEFLGYTAPYTQARLERRPCKERCDWRLKSFQPLCATSSAPKRRLGTRQSVYSRIDAGYWLPGYDADSKVVPIYGYSGLFIYWAYS